MEFMCCLPTMAKRRSGSTLVLVFVVVALSLIGDFRCDAQVLLKEEVQVLEKLASKMGIGPWDLYVEQSRFTSTIFVRERFRSVGWDCSFNNFTVCHVNRIDLSLNNLNGTIPRRFASLPLVNLSLYGNLIGETIPREFGSIATLEELILQDNKIGGQFPEELGNLPNLRRILLSGNNFTGVLPETFGNLRNLTDLIDGSTLSGRIHEFIGNWTQLTRLDMQGTSMEGPIPSTIFDLRNLEELRITDLNVSRMTFPDLYNLTSLIHLVLRNCSISGPIPPYIGEWSSSLTHLDLSFNRLTGTIPESLEMLEELQFMYLTNNSLIGEVSQWLTRDTRYRFDISYNNFTGSATSFCAANTLNYISSYPVEDNKTKWCWKKGLPCPNRPRSAYVWYSGLSLWQHTGDRA